MVSSATGTVLIPPMLSRMVSSSSWYQPGPLNPMSPALIDDDEARGEHTRRVRISPLGKVEELVIDLRHGLILERSRNGTSRLEDVAFDPPAPEELTGWKDGRRQPIGVAHVQYDPRGGPEHHRTVWEVTLAGILVFTEDGEADTLEQAMEWSRQRAEHVLVRG